MCSWQISKLFLQQQSKFDNYLPNKSKLFTNSCLQIAVFNCTATYTSLKHSHVRTLCLYHVFFCCWEDFALHQLPTDLKRSCHVCSCRNVASRPALACVGEDLSPSRTTSLKQQRRPVWRPRRSSACFTVHSHQTTSTSLNICGKHHTVSGRLESSRVNSLWSL